MLDLKRIRKNKEEIKIALGDRGEKFDISLIDQVIQLDQNRRDILLEVEDLKSKKNTLSIKVSKYKKDGKDASEIMSEIKELSDKIREFDARLNKIDEEIKYIMLRIPNIPHADVPSGATEDDNIEVRKSGIPRKFEFNPKEHWTIGVERDILDFEAGGKIAGSRFTVYKGLGARLERAIISFFLDKHIDENGYTEILPPYIVNRDSMMGTGQLPKFEEDVFKIADTEYFLIPTAEVPVTNLYRNEIIDGCKLPIKHVSYSACFRAESGSAGRDTRGLVRQHQFNKVELVKFVRPEDSYKELESLVNDAESVLKALKLPYRVVKICKGDLGFTAAFKYDLEVWMPSYNKYVEISSCSNFEDFQARRADIKYKESTKSKPNFVHTLNGSGVAIGRTVAAILENYQNYDGTVTIPEVLVPYMGGRAIIK